MAATAARFTAILTRPRPAENGVHGQDGHLYHHGGDDRRTAQEGRRCGQRQASGRRHGRHGFLSLQIRNPGKDAGAFVYQFTYWF